MTRDALVIGAALVLLTGLSWAYLYHDATVGHCSRMGLAGTATDFIMLLVMWTVMMAAMMLPSAAPMILMFANVNRRRAARATTALPTTYFVLAYLLIWTAFSLAATATQWWLSSAALLTTMSMELVSRPAAAGLFVVAGVFQWTRLKRACLQHCHTPFTFLMRYWRDGRGCVRDGPAPRALLCRLLLGSHGAAVRRRCHESRVGAGAVYSGSHGEAHATARPARESR